MTLSVQEPTGFVCLSVCCFAITCPFLRSHRFRHWTITFLFFFKCSDSMHGCCYVWPCLTEFSGVVLNCFTLPRWTIFTEVLHIEVEDSPIVYSMFYEEIWIQERRTEQAMPLKHCAVENSARKRSRVLAEYHCIPNN